MGDMAEVFRAMDQHDRERRERNLSNADLTGFKRHNEYHYSRDLRGDRLDYWPSRNRFRWRGRTYTGDVHGFIKNRSLELEGETDG